MTKQAYAPRATARRGATPARAVHAASEPPSRQPMDLPSMLLHMQRTAGNQAVTQLIRGYKAGTAPLQAQRRLSALLPNLPAQRALAVQRGGGAGAVEEAEEQEQEQDQEVEPDAFDAVVAHAQGRVVPDDAPGGGEHEGEEEQVQEQREEAREVLSPLIGGISEDQPHVAKVVLRELARNDDGGGDGVPAPGPQQGGGVQAPGGGPVDAAHLAELKKAAMVRAAQAGAIAASLAKNEKAGSAGQSRASRRGILGLINTVASKVNMVLGLAPKATALLEMVAKVGAAVTNVMHIIQAVTTPVGLAFGVVQGWLDLRSLVSSLAKWRRLNKLANKTLEQAKVLQDVEQARAKGELAGAIKYAAAQK
ncbi:MAG: hypothetical protein ACRDIE_19530, partial [Chloroflexota bacterium]